jgi:hypothetical protein
MAMLANIPSRTLIHKTIILPVVLYGCDIKKGTQTGGG